jgi:hypothetical protein
MGRLDATPRLGGALIPTLLGRRLPVRLVLLAAILVASLAAVRVDADRGVAIDLGAIDIERDLAKGGSYTLPTLGVSNPGDEPSRYRMSVTYFRDQAERRPESDWFDFSPREFELSPGATQAVDIELRIPPGARPGDYGAILQASIVREEGGVELGAAAGTSLSFTVKPSSFLEAWLLWLREFIDDNWVAIVTVGGLLALAALIWWARSRFSFRVERR